MIISEIRELRGGRPILPVAGGWIEVRGRAMATGLGDWDALIHHGPGGGRPIGAAEALALMLDRLSRQHGAQGRALARRVRASRQRIAAIAAARMDRPDGPPDHLTAEQAMIAGHWMHPCPKALSGMTLPEERAMTPDWRGALRLRLLSVVSDLIEATAPDLARDLPGMDIDPGPGRGLLPVHPLAWDRARHDPRIAALIAAGAVTDLGPMGPGWWATSSVRTLWRPDSPWQLKTSLPVTITNSQRVNRRHEMLAGAAMAGRAGALSGRFGPLRLVADSHWMTLRLPGGAASGLEVILRDNPWRGGRGGAVMQLGGWSRRRCRGGPRCWRR
ncbi:IucA/IucC family protein [Paracoccus aestuarii]|uniref:IucA/IucC family protein n=1 Tax=Paracoccus aestuarii TaxID=453842 RepID=UPI002350B7D1|nr:IucA/IucC family protein [Paracoccus aestuarii]WCR00936.1 IucA/IucC family protein [Paracoccus aestuarii]